MHKERGFLGVLTAVAVAVASFFSIPLFQTSQPLMSNLGGTGTIYNLPIKTFLALTDTPNSYTGQGTKVVSVNAGETALEFTTIGATTPGGSDTQVQFNDSSAFGGDAGFTYNKTTDTLSLGVNTSSLGKLKMFGNTSGDATIQTPAIAGTATVLTLPAITDTLVGKATTDIFTNKTLTSSTNVLGGVTMTLGSDADGDIYYRSSNVLSRLAKGTAGQVLTMNGGATAPEWTSAGAGTVTNTGGNLTANAVVLGAGTADTKVATGITTDGTSQLNLGVNSTTLGKLKMFGNTSGDVTIQPAAVAGTATVLTLPAVTDTLIGKATTDTLTNKTFDTAGTGNSFAINGTGITAVTGTGSAVLANSPTLTTPTLGVASATTINKVALTAPATGSTLTIADGKTLTASNSITLAGTDGKGINVGAATTGKILIGDGTNMVLSSPTFPNTATANKIMKADGANWVASTETYAAPGTDKNVMKSDGTNWTSAAPTFEGMVEAISFQDAGTAIAATTYVLELYAEYAYTINEMRIISGAGTVTANLKIGSTSVTSCSAVSVTTTITVCTASGANTVAVGDKITLVTTSNSGLENLQATIKTTRN